MRPLGLLVTLLVVVLSAWVWKTYGKKKEPSPLKARTTARLGISVAVGLVVAITSCLAAWRSLGGLALTGQQERTSVALGQISRALDLYRADTISLPASLLQFTEATTAKYGPSAQYLEQYYLTDGWGKEFHYCTEGDDYLVMSYGRDGKAGGSGLDADISNKNPHPAEAMLGLYQFVAYGMTRGMAASCILSGVLAFALTLVILRPIAVTTTTSTGLVMQIAFTLVGAIVISIFLVALHIPSGH